VRNLLIGIVVFALATWWWIWFGVFRRASRSNSGQPTEGVDPPPPLPEPESNEQHETFSKLEQFKGDQINQDLIVEFFSSTDCARENVISQLVLPAGTDDRKEAYHKGARSMKLSGNSRGHAEFFWNDLFLFSGFHLDGCIRLFDYPRPNTVRLFAQTPMLEKKQISEESLLSIRANLLPDVSRRELLSKPAKYRVVFSCESSEYFGYQVWANRLAFSQSQKGYDATWTRLLTSHTPDDIASDPRFPTFAAHRSPYAPRYSPINKPDVITKWYASVDAPKEEVIVVIDPDSWLLKTLYDRFVERVTEGNALGQAAYYTGSRTAQVLWRELCEKNCDKNMDLVGVPYVVHRNDLAKIAPLWKYYVLKIKFRLEATTPGADEFSKKYQHLDVNWASEMYGYNMAAAHLGIKHEIVWDLQVRDVDGERTFEKCKNKVSLHMGRAWFPKGHPAAKPWLHTEGRSFAAFGDQVWCKCNFTASTVKPWPVPDGLDFVSFHTLRLLHESEEEFGPIPENEEWRHKKHDLKHGYGWAHP
jgi:hypothetical protein